MSVKDPGGMVTAGNGMNLLPLLDDIMVQLLVGSSIVSSSIPRRTDGNTILVDYAFWKLEPDGKVVGLQLARPSGLRSAWKLSIESCLRWVELRFFLG